ELAALSAACGRAIDSYEALISALEDRRRFFCSLGARATDHGVLEPYTTRLPLAAADAVFRRALNGAATPADQREFEAHMLVEMARMSVSDGLVMQLHAGALRDHNPLV